MNLVVLSFLKKAAYALIANLVAALGLWAAQLVGYQPVGLDAVTTLVWGLVVSILTGAVAALKRHFQLQAQGEPQAH